MGTDVRSMFDKEFLYSFDLQGKDVTVIIDKVKAGTLTGVGGKKNKKPIVYFRGKEKGLGLNITNARIIAAMYGGFEVEKWIGKAITLFPTTTTFGDKTVDCIRVRPQIPRASGRGAAPATPESAQETPRDDDDEDAVNRRNAAPADDEGPQ